MSLTLQKIVFSFPSLVHYFVHANLLTFMAVHFHPAAHLLVLGFVLRPILAHAVAV